MHSWPNLCCQWSQQNLLLHWSKWTFLRFLLLLFSVPEVINHFEIIGIISVSLTDMYANFQKLTIIIIITLTITINKKHNYSIFCNEINSSVLLRCYYALALPILEYCSPLWRLADNYQLQFLERQVHSVAKLCPEHAFLSLSHRRHVATLCMLQNIYSNSNNCLLGELPSMLLPEFDILEQP